MLFFNPFLSEILVNITIVKCKVVCFSSVCVSVQFSSVIGWRSWLSFETRSEKDVITISNQKAPPQMYAIGCRQFPLLYDRWTLNHTKCFGATMACQTSPPSPFTNIGGWGEGQCKGVGVICQSSPLIKHLRLYAKIMARFKETDKAQLLWRIEPDHYTKFILFRVNSFQQLSLISFFESG